MKRLDCAEALFSTLEPGNSIVLHSACAEPAGLAHLLALHAGTMGGVHVHTLMPMGEAPYAAAAPSAHLKINTFFPGRGLREAFNAGRVTPYRYPLSAIPGLFDRNELDVDVLLLQVSVPDAKGMVSLGVSVDYMRAALRRKPLVIAEINPRMPRTCGDTGISVAAIDWFIDGSNELQTLLPTASDDIELRIAENVASLVRDRAVLQVGIGSLPDSVLSKLGHLKHLGLHSGILTDAVRPLIESGVIDNSAKKRFRGISVTTMAAGTQSFYDFLDDNPAVEFHPCSLTHDNEMLSAIDGLTAINSVLQIDLAGFANAEQANGKRVALPGGLPDFAAGATRALGGMSIIALRSSFKNEPMSNIIVRLGADAPVSVGPDHIDYVVTEYGVAPVRGISLEARAQGLIAIAHPNFRETLASQFRSI